jgi:hypothetical protein
MEEVTRLGRNLTIVHHRQVATMAVGFDLTSHEIVGSFVEGAGSISQVTGAPIRFDDIFQFQ